MRAMREEGFRGYQDLRLLDVPKPQASEGRADTRVGAVTSAAPGCVFDPQAPFTSAASKRTSLRPLWAKCVAAGLAGLHGG
jgi:hypothetical protein